LFGLLAVQLAVRLSIDASPLMTRLIAAVFFALSLVFVYRSFYGMRIGSGSASHQLQDQPERARF